MSMEYKGGYKSEAARSGQILVERRIYEQHIQTRDLVDLAGRIERGEPHEVNPNYGQQGFTYLYPETVDLGRLKVTPVNDTWEIKWEARGG